MLDRGLGIAAYADALAAVAVIDELEPKQVNWFFTECELGIWVGGGVCESVCDWFQFVDLCDLRFG